MIAVGPGTDNGALADHILRSNAVVAAGGDGTVHHAAAGILGAARERGVDPPPLYHLGWGNENLFAREFGMARRAGALAAALSERRIGRVDVGWIQGCGGVDRPAAPRLFLIMAGFGPDASVIHRLDAVRTRATGHLAYAGPFLAELRRPSFPAARVSVDGRTVVAGEPGMLVVANSRQFALRLDPARSANITDGVLDIVFMPCTTVAGALAWALRCRLGRQTRHPSLVTATGRRVVVESPDGRLPCQIDGEAMRAPGPFTITIEPGVLPVLLPGNS